MNRTFSRAGSYPSVQAIGLTDPEASAHAACSGHGRMRMAASLRGSRARRTRLTTQGEHRMPKIKVKTPVVEPDGDEMTRII
jgi:hypothetical protein